MELSLLRKISKWVSHTNDVGRDHLRHVLISCIVHYGQVKLNLPLLQAARNFWDHTRHVFRFNRCKLCPMMEEFGAVMGLSNFNQILLPPKHVDPVLLLEEVLSTPYRFGSSWSENDGFDLHALVNHLEVVDEECYPEALAVVVLAGFFLTDNFSEIDAMVLDTVSRMDMENLVPMILGETLNGFDELREGMCPYFKGSPLLLQV
jgi:hypothetical protein